MRVRRTGKSYAHPLIILIAAPNEGASTRFGVTASKAVGGAVSRNKAKRRIRAAVQPLIPAIRIGWDLIFVARAPLVDAEWTELCKSLSTLLKRAHLLDDRQ